MYIFFYITWVRGSGSLDGVRGPVLLHKRIKKVRIPWQEIEFQYVIFLLFLDMVKEIGRYFPVSGIFNLNFLL